MAQGFKALYQCRVNAMPDDIEKPLFAAGAADLLSDVTAPACSEQWRHINDG